MVMESTINAQTIPLINSLSPHVLWSGTGFAQPSAALLPQTACERVRSKYHAGFVYKLY